MTCLSTSSRAITEEEFGNVRSNETRESLSLTFGQHPFGWREVDGWLRRYVQSLGGEMGRRL